MEDKIMYNPIEINSKFIELIKQNPDLPILAWVNYEVVAGDDYAHWLGEISKATIEKYVSIDKNDKMIFEGDIIQNRRFNKIFYVYWNEEGLFWELVDTTSNIHHQLNEINIEAAWGDTPSYEIIGNIHD
jgi:hypothetical protein